MGEKISFVELIEKYIIRIPRIQRDYVQGIAITPEQEEKRSDFVDSLLLALNDDTQTCILDFIYGFTQNEQFIPLDGQQRLTSLFLLHWYFAFRIRSLKTEDFQAQQEFIDHLKGRFVYSNRVSSTEFCERVTSFKENDFNFEVKGSVVDVLKQQSWFDDEWIYDPTIESMLSMLRVYEKKLKDKSLDQLTSMAERLYTKKAIVFDKLDLEELHQGESLYVKMNARGKKLTQFENWKSKFTKMLDDNYRNEEFKGGDGSRCSRGFKEYFSHSIEHEWNDVFWHFVTKGISWDNRDEIIKRPYPTVDRSISNFLKFIHSLLYFKDKNDKKARISEFQWTFAQNLMTYGDNKENLVFLFQCLDFITAVSDLNDFFAQFFYVKNDNLAPVQSHKVRYYGTNGINLFELAISSYVNDKTKEIIDYREDSNRFDLTSQYLLFSILYYCAPKYCENHQIPIVDDNLRFYVRNCRNYLETVDQFLTGKVSLTPDISLVDAGEILSKLIKCQPNCKYQDNSIQELYEWLGDFDYIGGEAKAFIPLLDSIQNKRTSITTQMVKEFMTAFEQSSTHKRVQMLIGAGYQGKTGIGGVAENRTRYFFGQRVRWNVLFIEDSDRISCILEQLISDYDIDKSVDNLLNKYKNSASKNTFKYYMLNYEYALWAPNDPIAPLSGASEGEYFYAVAGSLDDMDLIAIRSISAQPLSAYHIDPLVCATLHERPNLKDYFDYIGRFGTKKGISIKDKDQVVFEMVASKDGWIVKTDDNNLLTAILNANSKLSYNKVFCLQKGNVTEDDKVKIGVAVLDAIAKSKQWANPLPFPAGMP